MEPEPHLTIPSPPEALKNTARLWLGGIWLSFSWLMLAGGLLWWKWDTLGSLDLNEWGDFLAGVVAPIALLWLVLGYFQQGIELRQNTEALRLQQEELARQVLETRELARNAARQADAYESLASLEAERSALEQRMRVAASQPSIEFERQTSFGPGGHLHLVNVGASITDLKVKAESQGAAWKESESHKWDSGKSVSLEYHGRFEFPVSLTLLFVDKLGAQRELKLTLNPDGRIRC